MNFSKLLRFIEADMRMSHVYQPVMLRTILRNGGRASVETIARALLNEDRSQLDYYAAIVRVMVGRVLVGRGITTREGRDYLLPGFESLTPNQVDQLIAACEIRLQEYVERRGANIWAHRRRGATYVSGTLRYEVLKAAKFRCELCGISAEERALEVDHIVPRNRGGSDDRSNLQALCYRCNATKRDRDDTDFRAVNAGYGEREPGCPFCEPPKQRILLESALAVALKDGFPVSPWHVLVVPRRHEADWFALGTSELRACLSLMEDVRRLVLERDKTVTAFNVGINAGRDAGQTVMHAHAHLIPRRAGDVPDPRGGVRCVIPGKALYRGE